MLIRHDEAKDHAAIHALNVAAFGQRVEADLVDTLRREAQPIISLVAEEGGAIVGHILFSPVILSDHPDLKLMGLGPMAVAPNQHGKGIGSQLVRAGLEQCRQLGCVAVVVVGHSEYYTRFGFAPGAQFHIGCEFEVPSEVFMAIELQPGCLRGKRGIVRYHSAFSNL